MGEQIVTAVTVPLCIRRRRSLRTHTCVMRGILRYIPDTYPLRVMIRIGASANDFSHADGRAQNTRRNENPGAAEITDKWVGHVGRIWLVIIICSACVGIYHYRYYRFRHYLRCGSRAHVHVRNTRVHRTFGIR